MSDTCPTCGQPMPVAPRSRPKRVQTTYRPFNHVYTADDLSVALAAFRANHGCDPRSIVVGEVPEGLDAVDGVPVIADPVVAKPAGVAYMEVGA